MIKITIQDGECECAVSGNPCVLAAELTQIEGKVFEEIAKTDFSNVAAFGMVYSALMKGYADVAKEMAKQKTIWKTF